MANSEVGASSLDSVEKIIPALGDLFVVVWDKSPALGSLLLVLMGLFPFYLVYAVFIARRPGKAIDQKVLRARKASKKRLKHDSGGK
jgi:hypothetical protein